MKPIEGILETFHQGFGFIRTESDGDVFVDSAFIAAYQLKNNDFIIGEAETDKEGRSQYILKRSNRSIESMSKRSIFPKSKRIDGKKRPRT